ncbi:conserved hypothetical protein [Magnetococcus marinus MC-1]|uniref:FecR protein domain-containing protein n=1 Tax=Magnetococcus marinus (strain ATCC BAA-1437 / JCM 17883 / MC-1) TaxID=156889 RepID=A0LDU2_MAGMM|nr:hypothetical protein [Magnetococcus marinus]ABK46135.1 conserved hypothetical protein [Magnetococcus marinus MC-1]
MTHPRGLSRRHMLQWVVAWGMFTPWLSACMQRGMIKPGLHLGAGGITANGHSLMQGEAIPAGALLQTDMGTQAVVVIGQDALLLRPETQLQLDPPTLAQVTEAAVVTDASPSTLAETLGVPGFLLQSGGVLSVFAQGRRQLRTPQALIGIHGTGIYLELEAQRTYACTCYGTVTITPTANPNMQARIQTHHHDDPRYIDRHGDNLMVTAPVINHTDAELTMLEALVLRKPPFISSITGISRYSL